MSEQGSRQIIMYPRDTKHYFYIEPHQIIITFIKFVSEQNCPPKELNKIINTNPEVSDEPIGDILTFLFRSDLLAESLTFAVTC